MSNEYTNLVRNLAITLKQANCRDQVVRIETVLAATSAAAPPGASPSRSAKPSRSPPRGAFGWNGYARNLAKKVARRAWAADQQANAIAATPAFSAKLKRDRAEYRYVAHAASWLEGAAASGSLPAGAHEGGAHGNNR